MYTYWWGRSSLELVNRKKSKMTAKITICTNWRVIDIENKFIISFLKNYI